MTPAELIERQRAKMHLPVIADGVRLVERAKQFAIQAHGDQKYGKGDEPYLVHLKEVDGVLIEFSHISSVLRAAAYLHDVVEDTATTIETVRQEFPGFVSIIVECNTSEPGKNRKERNAATYPKIAQLKDAIILKLADRIANVRHGKGTDGGLVEMYKKEYPAFREALKTTHSELLPMWWELDQLMDWQGG